MSSTVGEQLAARVLPPRRGGVVALAVDATARAYALGSLAFNGQGVAEAAAKRAELFLTIQAETAAVYYYLSSTSTADIDNTAAIAAGGTLALTNSHAAVIEAGGTAQVCIDRSQDKYLVVKTASGTATVRIYASSESV